MNDVTRFIESGILEMYVLGQTTPEETSEVEKMAMIYDEVSKEIEEISIALEKYAEQHAVEPNVTIEPMLMATIDYMERIKSGEIPSCPPILNEQSKIIDFAAWLNREDLLPVEPINEVYASIIGHTPQATTAMVWLRNGAPGEVHTNEHEKFLIVEGTCDIIIENEVYSMHPGDYMTIPLHKKHKVRVTSDTPCMVILQRVAA